MTVEAAPFVCPGEVLLAQVDDVKVYHNNNRVDSHLCNLFGVPRAWLQRIRVMQNVRENCVDASMVITSFRAIFLKAPERDLGPQGLLELLSKPLAAPEQAPGVLLHIYYSLPLSWVQELSTPDDAALSFRLYDGDRLLVRFAGAARLDASINDFLRRVNDGRVHYSKFAVAHHAAFVEQARRRAASELSLIHI